MPRKSTAPLAATSATASVPEDDLPSRYVFGARECAHQRDSTTRGIVRDLDYSQHHTRRAKAFLDVHGQQVRGDLSSLVAALPPRPSRVRDLVCSSLRS